MKKVFKKIVIIIAVIMILLSTFAPCAAFAADENPNYDGLPQGGVYGAITFTDWILNSLKDLFDWFIGIVTYAIKAVFLGWAGILEKAVTAIVGIGTATDIEGSLTVEKIVTNQVPILDVNFFNFSDAGGRALNSDSIIYMIRSSIAQFYYIIRNVTIGGMLVTLIYIGLRIAMTSIAETKAKYKAMLMGWAESMVLVFFIHYIMVFIIRANEWFITVIKSTLGGAEETLYDTIRSQAYAIQASIGWPATIIYVCLLYLLVKFLIMYLRRFANVAILTFLAPVVAISYSIDKIKDGKSQSFSKWLKDYIINVFIQAVHCLLYFLFVRMAFNVAGQSIYGVILALFLISCISKFEKVFKNIFGMENGKGMAPLGGIGDSSLKSTLAKAQLFRAAAKTNVRWVGAISKPITKPIRFVGGLGRGLMRDARLSRIQQSLYMARVTGSNTVSLRSSPLGRKKEYSVGQLIATGQELGYSDKDLAKILQSGIREGTLTNLANDKESVKGAFKNAGALVGMATSIPLMMEDPILGYKRFQKYRERLKIKGYDKDKYVYTGSQAARIRYAAKHNLAVAGIASSIPMMAINPVAGAGMLVAFARMRKTSIRGYNGGNVTNKTASTSRDQLLKSAMKGKKIYKAQSGMRASMKEMSSDFMNFNTLNVVPMVRQLKANMTANEQGRLVQTLTLEYELSNQMIQEQISKEYQRLVNDPNVDQKELERVYTLMQTRVTVEGIKGNITPYTEPKKVELKSYKDMATVDKVATQRLRRKESREDVTIIKPDDDVDIIDFAKIVMDYAEDGDQIISEYKGFKVDSKKYSTGVELYKDILTQGGTTDEEEVLKKLNEENGTNYTSLDEMFKELSKKKEKEKAEDGEIYISGLEKLSEEKKQEIIDNDLEAKEKNYIEKIIEAVSMKSAVEINSEGVTDEVIDIIKAKLSLSKGKKEDNVSIKEVSKYIASMSKDEIVDVMEVAVTKKSTLLKGSTPTEFRRLISLTEKEKYNNYVIGQISYDRRQAANVAEKIKIDREKGVK